MSQPLPKKKHWYYTLKLLVDTGVALTLLIGLSPLWIALIGITLVVNRGQVSQVFFRQWRPGQYGKPFLLIKIKTLEADGSIPNAWSSWLRRSGLDEWPQLFHILTGTMSFVGPRPLLMEYLPKYTEYEALRMVVKPGITGLAQVKGRNLTTWKERFYWDRHYVLHFGLWMDISILAETAKQLMAQKGNNQQMAAWQGPESD